MLLVVFGAKIQYLPFYCLTTSMSSIYFIKMKMFSLHVTFYFNTTVHTD